MTDRTKAMDDLIAQDADLIDKLRDEDSYYRIQERHWCIDAEELERQRLAAANRIAEQAAELAKWKALAETLAGALEDHLPSIVKRSTLLPGEKGDAVQLEVNLYKIADRAAALAEALRQYKEARDA